MTGTQQTSAQTGSPYSAAPLNRPQRQELLRLLLLGRGLDRVLASIHHRPGAPASGEREATLAAVAAAAALEPGDRLVAAHGFLAAHLAGGVGPGEVAAARLGEPSSQRTHRGLRVGIGPQAPAGIAAGVALALALGRGPGRRAAMALIDARWAVDEGCVSALSLAHELALPLVVVAIDGADATGQGAAMVDRRDFEAVRAAVAAALADARDEHRPSLVAFGPSSRADDMGGDQVARFRTRIDDSVASYERWLMIHGFSRADLDTVHRAATNELDDALGARVAATARRPGGATGQGAE
jgi:TPP-dependent pyruvate/acetoin dehydrogenase alpha subunit